MRCVAFQQNIYYMYVKVICIIVVFLDNYCICNNVLCIMKNVVYVYAGISM